MYFGPPTAHVRNSCDPLRLVKSAKFFGTVQRQGQVTKQATHCAEYRHGVNTSSEFTEGPQVVWELGGAQQWCFSAIPRAGSLAGESKGNSACSLPQAHDPACL